jgi:LysR family glycine cleavage system transcriptional activator
MKRTLPPFPALRAFEAAGRLGSFKEAAAELCVSPSAISHQIKLLESYLDLQLFLRTAQDVRLTQEGTQYLRHVTPILDQLDLSTRSVTGHSMRGVLRLKMTEWFAKRWLIPRMPSFMQAHPDLELAIETGLPPTDFRGGDLDLIIHWGDQPVEGVAIEPFFAATRTPVCSPAYLRTHPELQRPIDLIGHVLLRDETSDGWEEWFTAAELPDVCPGGGPRFAHCELSTAAALDGVGVALAYRELLSDMIDAGDLRQVFDITSPVRTIYSLAYQNHRSHVPKILAFRNWLFDQILLDAQDNVASPKPLEAAQ